MFSWCILVCLKQICLLNRSSHWRCSIEKDALKFFFTKFVEKHLCRNLFFNKVADRGLQHFWKKAPIKVFSCEICKSFQRAPLGDCVFMFAILCLIDLTIKIFLVRLPVAFNWKYWKSCDLIIHFRYFNHEKTLMNQIFFFVLYKKKMTLDFAKTS